MAQTALSIAASIPSPSESSWNLGPIPIRAYAMAILLGIVVATWYSIRRYRARGGPEGAVLDIVLWAVPFGIVGGRIYHVISSPDAYWGPGGDPWKALRIWDGGLGIWGAIALGAVGAWIGCRRLGLRFAPVADAMAPTILIAQGIGRLGNWFNQELFGAPTTLPWGLEIDDYHRPLEYAAGTLFHPTFLYEMLWNFAMAALLIYLDRKFKLSHGRVFWLYVFVYTIGRFWIEGLRVDPAEQVLGLRLNEWTSILVGLVALIMFIVIGRRRRGEDETVFLPGREPATVTGAQVPDNGSAVEAPTEPDGEGPPVAGGSPIETDPVAPRE